MNGRSLTAAGLLILLLFIAAAAAAETVSGTCGAAASWTLDTDTGVLTIGGSGAMDDWPKSEQEECAGWYAYMDSIRSVVFEGSVTTVGRAAFAACTALERVTIPQSVQSIGINAFGGCTALTDVTLENGAGSIGSYAFQGCGVVSLVLPDSVGGIGNYAFMNCTGLRTVTIGGGITAIGQGAFTGCTGAAILVSRTRESCGGFAEDAFEHCASVRYLIPGFEISADGTLTAYTGSGAEVVIPDEVSAIGEDAFRGCGAVVSIEIPDTVGSVGAGAFAGCTALESISIPASVSRIGENALAGCTALRSVVNGSAAAIDLPETEGYTWHRPENLLVGIGRLASGAAVRVADDLPEGGGAVRLPPELTAVERETLAGIAASEIYAGSRVKTIGARAFADCSAPLLRVHLPSGVETIAADAFRGTTVILYGPTESAVQRYAERYGLAFIAE